MTIEQIKSAIESTVSNCDTEKLYCIAESLKQQYDIGEMSEAEYSYLYDACELAASSIDSGSAFLCIL